MASRLDRLNPADYALPEALLGQLMTPALVIHIHQVRRNIARVLDYMGGDATRWRPHLKTTKIQRIYEELLASGLRQFKCATVREARTLLDAAAHVDCPVVDLLIAYPLMGPALDAASRLAAQYPGATLSVLSEDRDHCLTIPHQLGIFVDVDPGMHRTGVAATNYTRIGEIAAAAGDRFRGLHFYDGHIHWETPQARRTAAHGLYDTLVALALELAGAGLHCDELITSGTPTFLYALDYPQFCTASQAFGIHRVSPGTVVFHDLQYDELLADLDLEPAAVVATRVISRPDESIATCDAGSKAVAAEAGDPVAYVVGYPGLIATRPSEEHLPLNVAQSNRVPERGDVLTLVPRHICPTVNLAERALLIEPDGSSGIVEVAARAHDLSAAGPGGTWTQPEHHAT